MSNKITVNADIPQEVNYQTCTVNVGSTTTLPAGQEASVTNSGTQYNAILDFGIPCGKGAYEQAVEGGYQGTEEEFEQIIASSLNTVADNVEDVNTVAANIPDLHTVAENVNDVNTVATDISNVNTVAGISSDVTQVSSISNAIQTVSNHDSEVTLVADNMASVMTTASSITDVQNVASDIANINTVAGISSDVSTVATNSTAVNTAATNIAAIIAAPTAATNAATSATNAQKWAEGTDAQVQPLGGTKSSKGWANRAQELVESIGTVMKYKGSVANYAALQAIQNPTIGDTYNVLDTGSNYTWDGSAWDAIGSVVDLSAYRTAADQDVIDSGKQATLVSGTNIKTVNGDSILGSGNVDIDALPSQTGQNGKFLTTNGTAASWADVDALPSQTGQSGKYLTTDGTTSSWATVEASSVAVGHWFDNVSGTTLGTGITGANIRVYKNGKLLQPGQAITARLYTGGYGKSISLAQTAPIATANSWSFETRMLWDNSGSGTSPCVLCYTGTTDCKAPVIIYEVKMGWYLGSTGTSWDLDTANNSSMNLPDSGSMYDFKAEFTGTSYIFSYKKDGSDWQVARQFTSTAKVHCSVPFLLLNSDLNPSRCYNSSTLDMSKTKIVVDGTTWFDGATAVAGTDYTNNGCTLTEVPGSTNDYHYDPTTGVITFSERLYGDDIAIEYSETIGEGVLGRNIGEVFFSESSSAADNVGALPLFTGETISNADELYPDFYQWVADHTGLQISAADYETALTTYGECPKYVIDTTNKTIRLPKLANYLKMANTTDGVTQAGAGLPNITGTFTGYSASTGAISSATSSVGSYSTGGGTLRKNTLDASTVSSIYGSSTTVTPTHTTLFPWVCAYNAAVPASTAQAAQFQAALSSKLDSDFGNSTKPYVTETYVNGTSWYRIWSDGWCEQGGRITGTSITFLQSFVNTNYSFSGVSINSNSGGAASTVTNLTTTGCTYYTYGNAGGMWQACGYIR